MEIEKIRNTTEDELKHQEHELSDQLFRLKFQMKMGQTESLKKIRGLRRDIARIKTINRQRQLGIAGTAAQSQVEAAPISAAPVKPAKRVAAKRVVKPAAGKKKTEKR